MNNLIGFKEAVGPAFVVTRVGGTGCSGGKIDQRLRLSLVRGRYPNGDWWKPDF